MNQPFKNLTGGSYQGGGEKIKCPQCGEMFIKEKPHFKVCKKCNFKNKDSLSNNSENSEISYLLLKEYYDEEGNIKKEIFIGIPQKIAKIFEQEIIPNTRKHLSNKQVRMFHSDIARIRGLLLRKKFSELRQHLMESLIKMEYQLKRDLVTKSFSEFYRHHINIALTSEKEFEGFYHHFDSVVSYFNPER